MKLLLLLLIYLPFFILPFAQFSKTSYSSKFSELQLNLKKKWKQKRIQNSKWKGADFNLFLLHIIAIIAIILIVVIVEELVLKACV